MKLKNKFTRKATNKSSGKNKIFTVNRDRLSRGMLNLQTMFLCILMTVVLAIGAQYLTIYQLQTSQDVLLFKTVGDWVFVLLLTVSLAGMAWCVYQYFGERQRKMWFWLGNVGIFCLTGGLLGVCTELSMLPFTKITLANVKTLAHLVTAQYYVDAVVLVIVAGLVMWINQGWIKRNNWYVVASLTPYILLGAFGYRKYLSWSAFINSDTFKYSELYKMLNTYHKAGYDLALTLMNNLTVTLLGIGVVGIFILIIVGGGLLVQKARQATKRQIARRKANG